MTQVLGQPYSLRLSFWVSLIWAKEGPWHPQNTFQFNCDPSLCVYLFESFKHLNACLCSRRPTVDHVSWLPIKSASTKRSLSSKVLAQYLWMIHNYEGLVFLRTKLSTVLWTNIHFAQVPSPSLRVIPTVAVLLGVKSTRRRLSILKHHNVEFPLQTNPRLWFGCTDEVLELRPISRYSSLYISNSIFDQSTNNRSCRQ